MMSLRHLLDTIRSRLPGTHPGGDNAVSRADPHESISADAALGKARDLMRHCRRELAIQWYIRSLAQKQPPKSVLYELFEVGYAADDIQRLASAILTQTTTRLPAGSPTLLWDVTPLWLARRAGRPADQEALWSFTCGQTLAGVMTLGFAVYDVLDGEIKELTEHGKASLIRWSETTADTVPSAEDSESTHPIAVKPTVLFSSPHWSLPADRIGCILRPYLQKNVVLTAVIRNLDVWTWPEWFSPTRRAALRAIQKLYVSSASFIFTESDLGDASVHSVMKAADVAARPRVVPLPLTAAASPSAEHAMESDGKTLLVLTPYHPAELRSILEAYKVDPTARLVFIADDDSAEPDQTIARFAADNPNMDVSEIAPTGPRVRHEMRSAASLLLPKSRSDAELWIGEAAKAGIAVFSVVGRPIQECWSGSIDGFLNSSDPRNFSRHWLLPRSYGKRPGLRAEVVRASVEEVRRNMTEAAGQATVAQQLDFAHQGVFYCLSSAERAVEDARIASGIEFRSGPGWGSPTGNGTPIIGREGILKFRFWSVHRGPHRCMLLVASPGTTACRAHVELTLGGQTAAAEIRLRASELRWIRLEFDPGAEIHSEAKLAICTESDGPESEGDPSLLVVGWFNYPVNDDVCWFEFLESASAGKLPVLTRRYRRSVIDSLRISSQRTIEVPPTTLERRAASVSDRQ